MKRYLSVLGMLGLTPFAASALELKTSVTASPLACHGSPLHQVAAGEQARAGCAGPLSTQRLLLPQRALRT